MTITERPFQQKNCDGTWGPLIINGKRVDYQGYPYKPAPSTIEAMKQYDNYCDIVCNTNIKTSHNTKEPLNKDTMIRSTKIDESKITIEAHEDCNGTTYYHRGYYENLPNGGFKWIDCGSG